MTSPDLFDGEAKDNAVTLIRRFVAWFDQHQKSEPVNIDWFVTECRDFLEDPYAPLWDNIEVEKPKGGSRALADASRQGEK